MNRHTVPSTQDGLPLPGLDGTNPLGFLAALGLLRTLNMQSDGNAVRMLWEKTGATWTPRIIGGGHDIDKLLERLVAGFEVCDRSPWRLDKKFPFETKTLRREISDATRGASHTHRDRIDTLGSFGVAYVSDDRGTFKDTSLRMIRAGDSAGNGLLAYGERIREDTTLDNLRSALIGPWKYEDEGCALRWDPAEHHGYAMQWTDPSKEKTVSVRGANRLALAAMPMLPVVPVQARVGTTAFGKPHGQQESLSWPIWIVACGIDVITSLLALACLQDERPSSSKLSARGIRAVYRCDRVKTSTYYRNFTPAQRVA